MSWISPLLQEMTVGHCILGNEVFTVIALRITGISIFPHNICMRGIITCSHSEQIQISPHDLLFINRPRFQIDILLSQTTNEYIVVAPMSLGEITIYHFQKVCYVVFSCVLGWGSSILDFVCQ